MRKIKVLHMTPPQVNNGVYQYLFSCMPYVDFEKYQFDFLTRCAEELSETNEYRKYRFGINQLFGTQRKDNESFEREINSVLERGYDVIHLHTSSWRGFKIEELAMRWGMKVIVHSHSSGIDENEPEKRQKLYAEHEWYKQSFSLTYATELCACSNLAARWLFGEQIPKDKIKILPNGIDTARFAFDIRKRDAVRKKYNLDEAFVIGCIGRFSYQKNQEFLIRIIYMMNNYNIKLMLIGEGDLKKEYEKKTHEYKIEEKVIFVDWVKNVEDYLCAMDLLCLPSHFEGFPISVVEAQASGVPCILSDRISQEVNILGKLKFLPLDEETWIENIKNYIHIDTDRREAFLNVQKMGYDVKDTSCKLLEMYGDI